MVFSVGIATLAVVVLVCVNRLVSRYRFNKNYKLPAVVPGWPIIGSSLDLPDPAGMWGVEMTKRYGEM